MSYRNWWDSSLQILTTYTESCKIRRKKEEVCIAIWKEEVTLSIRINIGDHIRLNMNIAKYKGPNTNDIMDKEGKKYEEWKNKQRRAGKNVKVSPPNCIII